MITLAPAFQTLKRGPPSPLVATEEREGLGVTGGCTLMDAELPPPCKRGRTEAASGGDGHAVEAVAAEAEGQLGASVAPLPDAADTCMADAAVNAPDVPVAASAVGSANSAACASLKGGALDTVLQLGQGHQDEGEGDADLGNTPELTLQEMLQPALAPAAGARSEVATEGQELGDTEGKGVDQGAAGGVGSALPGATGHASKQGSQKAGLGAAVDAVGDDLHTVLHTSMPAAALGLANTSSAAQASGSLSSLPCRPRTASSSGKAPRPDSRGHTAVAQEPPAASVGQGAALVPHPQPVEMPASAAGALPPPSGHFPKPVLAAPAFAIPPAPKVTAAQAASHVIPGAPDQAPTAPFKTPASAVQRNAMADIFSAFSQIDGFL